MLKSNSRPQYYVKLHQNSKCARLLPVTVIYVMYVIYYVNLWTSCNIFFGCVTAITVIAFFISYIWYGHAYCNHTAYTHSTISPVWVRVFTVTTALYKKLSCRREAAQCFVFVWSQLQHTAHFFITSYCGFRFTSAKNSIKFCSAVSLSPVVSGGVRPKLPGQTPLGHNPPCFLLLEGRLGSGPRLVGRIGSGVRVSVSSGVTSYGALGHVLELVQVVIFTLHVCSVAFPVHVQSHNTLCTDFQTHFRCSQKRS